MSSSGELKATHALGELHLIGPLVLLDENGSICTPSGKKSQALLALLALAPRGIRTRVWLRDKLWSMSTEERSSSSLRQTVFEIKKALGHFADTLLIVERNSIALRLDRIWIDVRVLTDNPGKFDFEGSEIDEDDLLEGLDVCDEEFEEWLLLERRAWEDKRGSIEVKPSDPLNRNVEVRTNSLPSFKRRISIAMLPTIRHGSSKLSAEIADSLLESITHNIVEFYPNDILDFRTELQYSDGTLDMLAADYFVRVRLIEVMGNLTVTLFLYRCNTTELIWSQSIQTTVNELMEDKADLLNQFIAQNVDRIARTINRETKFNLFEGGGQEGNGYGALLQMFDLDVSELNKSITTLELLDKNSTQPLFGSLLAYSETFKVGEHFEPTCKSKYEENWSKARQLLHQDSFNSIALSSLAHVLGYVFSKHDLAAELLKKAVQLNPSQAFVWDHLALHCLYTGRLDEADFASQRANVLGFYSPLKYSYETTSCMIASMRGQHERAVQLGESVLSKKPRFAAAMRYTLSSCGHLKHLKRADQIAQRLKKIDPDFFHKDIQNERFRLADSDAHNHIVTGIQEAGF